MRLKNLMLGAVLLALTAAQVSAQNVHLGLEAGTNFNSFIGSSVSVNSLTDSRLGLVGGGFLEVQFGNSFSVRPEILYAQKGGKDTSNNTYQLDYIEVPVLLKLSLGTPGVNPGLLLGPTFNLNIIGQVVNGGTSTDFNNLNKTDIGVMGGVIVDIDKFSLSARYEVGLTDISTSGGPSSHVQNGTFTLLAGFSFI